MLDGNRALLPPTLRLPAIWQIGSISVQDIDGAVSYLSSLYNPEIRGVRYISRRQCSLPPIGEDGRPRRTSNASIKQPSDVELDNLRADSFERAYAIQWLTTLVSHAGHLSEESTDWESIIQQAAGLLAICAGAASAGTRSRTFSFSSRKSPQVADIKVRITDLPLDNRDYSSVGAQTWGGACLLADMIVNSPTQFCLPTRSDRTIRILELGAGTGLVSLAAGKLLHTMNVSSELVATDFHPAVLENLRHNLAENMGPLESPVSVSAHFLDWSTFSASHAAQHPPPFDTVFDIIYGADIIYELEHAQWIKACVEVLLRKPRSDAIRPPASNSAQTFEASTAAIASFHLVIPLRATHTAESRSVEDVFPFAPTLRTATTSSAPADRVQGYVLAITGKEIIVCGDIWSEETREVRYVHYSIGWV